MFLQGGVGGGWGEGWSTSVRTAIFPFVVGDFFSSLLFWSVFFFFFSTPMNGRSIATGTSDFWFENWTLIITFSEKIIVKGDLPFQVYSFVKYEDNVISFFHSNSIQYLRCVMIQSLIHILFMGHVPTHPFPDASPDPNLTLTQTLDLTQGRVGTWPAIEQVQIYDYTQSNLQSQPKGHASVVVCKPPLLSELAARKFFEKTRQ